MVSDVLHIMSDLRSTGVSQVLRERGKATWETTGLLDRLASAADDTAMARLTSIFDISTRYESQFWDMVYATPPRGDV